jgi:SAM-dependent methyltransferase
MSPNLDSRTVEGFGKQWSVFDQRDLAPAEQALLFQRYFRIFPWEQLPGRSVGADVGCGAGRWAALVAPHAGRLYCFDASLAAARVARESLRSLSNCAVGCASAERLPVPDGSLDFVYSLGVLHHLPDPAAAMRACAAKLKPGAPFLVYLYYALENRPAWYRALWRMSDLVRRAVAVLPFPFRYALSQTIALLVYVPLARAARWLERRGRNVDRWPLSSYRKLSLYSIRTDALDRFGTRLERRFSADQIRAMMGSAGLERIAFSSEVPYWCAIGYRSALP